MFEDKEDGRGEGEVSDAILPLDRGKQQKEVGNLLESSKASVVNLHFCKKELFLWSNKKAWI